MGSSQKQDDQQFHNIQLLSQEEIANMDESQFMQYNKCLQTFIEGHNQAHESLIEMEQIKEAISS